MKKTVLGIGRPKIAVPISPESEAEAAKLAEAAKNAGADLIEFRADACSGCRSELHIGERLKAVSDHAGDIPILFTFRTSAEGGKTAVSAEEYEAYCLLAAESGLVDMIDIEYAHSKAPALLKAVHEIGLPVVLSNHDFHATPDEDEIVSRLENMQRMGGDIAKIACMPGRHMDSVVAEAAAAAAGKRLSIPYIVISMGEAGTDTRLSGEVYGSAVTFGALPDRASAPGQLNIPELRTKLEEIHAVRSGDSGFIFLIGFMGTGKTTAALKLSERIGLPVIEMDARIEAEQGKTISRIFEEEGEEAFRDMESELLAGLFREKSAVVSCGGGCVLRNMNADLMKALGKVVRLTAKPETLLARLEGEADNRPNIRGRMTVEGISGLMEKRRPYYESAADFVIETDEKSVDDICREVNECLYSRN